LVGRCFNCLWSDHVAAACTFAARCLRCHREGHQARFCKRPRSPDPPGRSELRIIPRTQEMGVAEDELANTLVARVGGAVPGVSIAQVASHFGRFFQVREQEALIRCYMLDGFLISFADGQVTDWVLHALQPSGADLMLVFQRWRCQSRAVFSPLRYKVLLSVENLLAHVWLVDSVQTILGSSCLVSEPSLHSVSRTDLSRFLVAAWAVHLDLISCEVECFVPELKAPSCEGLPPLLLRASELILSKRDALQFSVVIRLLEIHDFNLPSDSDDSQGSSGSSGADGLPRAGTTHLTPWPKIYNLAGGPSSSREPWPSLPRTGGGVSWSLPAMTAMCATCHVVLPMTLASPAPVAVARPPDGPQPDPACCCAVEKPTVCSVSDDPMLVEAQLPSVLELAPPPFSLC
ncbi:hypothetical protein BAE44_0022323, partial [Dichanthelium oligosanthes]